MILKIPLQREGKQNIFTLFEQLHVMYFGSSVGRAKVASSTLTQTMTICFRGFVCFFVVVAVVVWLRNVRTF